MRKTKIQILVFNQMDEQNKYFAPSNKDSDYNLSIVEHIGQTVEILSNKHIDILIINYTDDISIIENIKILNDIPCIFTTDYKNSSVIFQADKAGAANYIIRDKDNNYLKLMSEMINNILENKLFEIRKVVISNVENYDVFSRTEKALQASEEKYKALIEYAPIGILFSDTEGNIIDVNQTLLNVLGSPSADATKKINILKFKNLVDRGFDRDFNLCLKTGKLVVSETPYTSRWNKNIHIRYYLSCIYDTSKNIIGVQALIEDITERKLAEIALRESEELYRTLAQNLPGASVLLFDKDMSYKIAEGKAINISDIKSFDQNTKSVISPEYLEAYYVESLKGNKFKFEREHNDNIYLINILPVKNENNEIFAGMAVFQDITEQKKYEEQITSSLREKELLLKELNHRVKNNLQIISSLLSLQSGYIKDKESKELFRESQNRVRTMALIHEELYKTEKLAKIEFRQYAENLTNHLYQSYRISSGKIIFTVISEKIYLDIETAIPLGLIINELVSNSLKYAFRYKSSGEIYISLNKDNNIYNLTIADNGSGFPENFDFRNTTSLGLQLIVSLTNQLDGTIELDRSNGTKFNIKFEELKYKERF